MITDLLPRDGMILCAVSGGPDSMYLLERLRELGYPVAAAHFDHGLRGEASRRDAAFVRDWCQEHGIPFSGGEGDTAAYAARHRLGTEEAARILRYGFLERAADESSVSVIATAHTADDNAETVLLHLMRGAGLHGLCGIPPRRGRIVRPMLDVTRGEILDYLTEHGIPYVEDATNAGDEFARNRIRHSVIPALRAENPAFSEAVGRMARLLRDDEAFLDGLACRYIEDRILEDGSLSTEGFAALPVPVARRVVRRMAGAIPQEQTDRVLSLVQCGGTADISGMRVTVSAGRIAFGAPEQKTMPDRTVQPGYELLLPEAGLLLRCKKIRTFPDDVHKSFNTFLFTCENIDEMISVTSRRPGDRYRPLGRGCTKSLKALFLENRIPQWQRGLIPVLRDGSGILGVCGMPPAERAAARPGDENIIQIDFLRLDPEREG